MFVENFKVIEGEKYLLQPISISQHKELENEQVKLNYNKNGLLARRSNINDY